MPRRKSKKHKRTKHKKYKSEPKQSNWDNKKKLIICKLLQNICKKNAGVKDIADLVLSTTLSDEELKDMIKTSWCDSTIDTRMTCFFIDVLVEERKQSIDTAPTITQHFILSLFYQAIDAEHSSYMNECVVWSMNILQSLGITHLIPRACNVIIRSHCMFMYSGVNSLPDAGKWFLKLIGHLFNNDLLDVSFIYNSILNKFKDSSNKTIKMEMLYHVSKICGYKLYVASNNRFDAILDKYANEYQDMECALCMKLFDEYELKAVQTPCNHIFCRSCMHSCLQKGKNCPVCGKAFTVSELEFEPVVFMVFKVLKMRNDLNSHDLNSSDGFGIMAEYNITTNASKQLYDPIEGITAESLENATREEKSKTIAKMMQHLQETLGYPVTKFKHVESKDSVGTHSQNDQNENTNSNNVENKENNNDETGLCENQVETESVEDVHSDSDNSNMSYQQNIESIDKVIGKSDGIFQEQPKQIWESKYIELEQKYNVVKTNGLLSDKVNKTLREKLTEIVQKHKKQTSEIESLKLQNSEMKERYHNLDMECDVFKNEANKLEDRLLAKQNKNVKLDARCKILEDSLQQSVNNQKKMEQQYDKDITQIQVKYNDAIAQTKLTQNKMNQLQVAYDELETKFSQQQTEQKKFCYLLWNSTDIANWILNINKRKYKKYYNTLIKNMTNEGINGQCLHELNRNDLHRFGIINFNDKCDVLTGIRELIRNGSVNKNQSVSTNDGKCGRCVVCMDDIPVYICLPCRHLYVCEKCQNKLNGNCPICQTKYESLVKVFHDLI